MKKAKRLLACILAVVMIAITLASCNIGEETKPTTKLTEKTQVTSKPTDALQETESLYEDKNNGSGNGNTVEPIYEEKAVINGVEFLFKTNPDITTSTIIMINATKDFEGVVLTLPSKTPNGKTVTECKIDGHASNVPQFIPKSDFEDQILSKLENSQELTEFEKNMLKHFFKLWDLETYLEHFADPKIKEKQKEKFLKLYPFAEEVSSFYENTAVTRGEFSRISEILTKLDYTFEDNYLNLQKFEKETNYYVEYPSNVDNIEEIILPDTLTSLRINSFISLKKVNLSKNITTINLCYCEALTSIEIPNAVKEYSLANCSNLSNVVIHDGVTTIGDSAFENCTSLVSIAIPNSVTSIGNSAFENCTSLEYNEDDNAYYLGNDNNPYLWLIKMKDEDITSCNINENTKFICEDAFSRCTNLTSITIPYGVTSIGDNAFGYCSNLTSIIMPTSVESIGAAAFFCCTSLTNIIIPDSVTNMGVNAFYGCTSLEYNKYDCAYYLGNDNNPYLWLIKAKDQNITSCNINENTKFICHGYDITTESGAFWGCRNLTCLTIPDSITFIDGGAFSYCERLTTINYAGTKAEWKDIEKVTGWNDSTGNYIVHCTDGDIAKADDN